MSTSAHECPWTEEISALMDGAVAAGTRHEIEQHAVACPVCGAALRDFAAMRSRLQNLRDVRCEADIAALIADRLRVRPQAPQRARRHNWDFAWQWAPRGMAAAGVLAVGVYFGLLLAGGTAVMRPAAMAVFDPAPPGALCVGQPWCGPGGR